jgi:hypothetical protein
MKKKEKERKEEKNRKLKKWTGRDGGQTVDKTFREKENERKKIPGSGTIEFQSY